MKAEDTCDMIRRIGIRAEGEGAMVRRDDPLPEGIEDDVGEGQVALK